MPTTPPTSRRALSLLELVAAIAILGLLAALALPRTESVRSDGHRASCHVNRAEIELQAILWKRANAGWPLSDLSDIAADENHFPEGLPVCPVDGSAYTVGVDGTVVGHDH